MPIDIGFDPRVTNTHIALPLDVSVVDFTDENGKKKTIKGSYTKILNAMQKAGFKVVTLTE